MQTPEGYMSADAILAERALYRKEPECYRKRLAHLESNQNRRKMLVLNGLNLYRIRTLVTNFLQACEYLLVTRQAKVKGGQPPSPTRKEEELPCSVADT